MIPTGHILKALAVLVALMLPAFPALAQDTSLEPPRVLAPIEGTWRTLTGTEIFIQPCGNKFCGFFSHIVIPKKQADVCRSMPPEEFALLILDYNNPKRALQSRSLLGLNAVRIQPTNDPTHYKANIYNAEEGKDYDVQFWARDDVLTLGGGCIGSFCAVTQDWPRVPDREDMPSFTCEGGL